MSSMVRSTLFSLLAASAVLMPVSALAQQADEWDRARAGLVASRPGPMASAIRTWEQLTSNARYSFNDYAGFLISYADFPMQDRLRGYAEGRLREEYVPADRIVAFFDRFAPVTNHAKAHYAMALLTQRPADAEAIAREAWRGGEMSETVEAALFARFGPRFSAADHDARMDALLWQRERGAAERELPFASPDKRAIFQARLAILQGGDGATSYPAANSDPGYLYNRSRELRLEGRPHLAVNLLASRPKLAAIPFNQTAWVSEQLTVAQAGDARSVQLIASKIDDAFSADADISAATFKLRDDYTSLMWLGGTRALWELRDATNAAPLFYRYGAAARTPQTRSKGFFWAGHAASSAGDKVAADRYYAMAAAYPDRFYGQLALNRLGRSMPGFANPPAAAPDPARKAAFLSAPLTRAVREVARDAPWSTGIRFYREIADEAETVEDHALVAELAREIGRRDLAVNVLEAAGADGHSEFVRVGFPTLVAPPGANWTLVHAITRQESQFAQNAISHAGARGLMQLMPGTAREEAEKAGMAYMSASLIDDPGYNVRLGSNHIERLYARYGSYPLAVAAYNAGPGNVNKWLRANGDPRTGSISWIDWIERIPFFETKNYVQRVIENAVVYEALYPENAPNLRARGVEDFLR